MRTEAAGTAQIPSGTRSCSRYRAGTTFNALDGFESLRGAVHSFHPARGHTAAIAHAREPDISYRRLMAVST